MHTDPVLADLHNRTGPIQRQLHTAFKSGQIPKELFYKSLIKLAYEFAVAGYADEALILVMSVPPDYFKTSSTAEIEADKEYYNKAQVVAEVLRETHLLPTQKVANA